MDTVRSIDTEVEAGTTIETCHKFDGQIAVDNTINNVIGGS